MRVIVLAGIALVVAGLAVVALQPSEFRVTRSSIITAPAPVVFAQVNDFRKWDAWNPWARLDPAMRQGYAGAPAGVGAVYTWAGNGEVGEGRMTITDSRPHELIRIRMEFMKPFAATSTAEFTFRPEGDGTRVTWSMAGENGFMAKAIHMVVSMDRMIGGMFEKGLAAMKAVAETASRG
jgi:hypothetical protein